MSYQQQPTKDGFDTLYNAKYGQTFHSTHGAFTESEHVFLRGSGVTSRLAAGRPTRILEIGFGTGLNFMVTARQCQLTKAALHYVALEKELLPIDVLAQLNYGDMLENDIWGKFLVWRNSPQNVGSAPVLQWESQPNIQL